MACAAGPDGGPAVDAGVDAEVDAGVAMVPAAFCGIEAPAPTLAAIDLHADLLTLLNALPRPLTLPCVLAALPRPLSILATTSTISLQPAEGRGNPRIFLRAGQMVMSIALTGDQSTHIETAEPAEPGFSVKGDLGFPQADVIVERQFFEEILFQSGTSCGFCHSGEHVARMVDGMTAFSSRALRPLRSQLVTLAEVRALAEQCPVDDQGLRCQMLRALFHGPHDVGDMQFLEGTTTLGGLQ